MKKIKNIADMCKKLKLSVYIWGEKGVGKTFLARYIAPNALINPKTGTINPVILEDFDKNPILDFKKNIIIATGKDPLNKDLLKRYFTMDIELKPLKEHPEDIKYFTDLFINQAKKELKTDKTITINSPDIKENLNSLKRQIYSLYLIPRTKEKVFEILKNFYENEQKDTTYEQELKHFEKALFTAMKTKYKSKLQIAGHLKINRVTLTKKMKALDV